MKLSSTISCARAKISQAENGNFTREQLLALLGILDIKLQKLESGTQELEALHVMLGNIIGHVECKTSNVINFERTHITEDSSDER